MLNNEDFSLNNIDFYLGNKVHKLHQDRYRNKKLLQMALQPYRIFYTYPMQ